MVVAPGPSLNAGVAQEIAESGWPVVVCQDAYRLMPWADVLYGCDVKWWNAHNGCDFAGEKWSSHSKDSCSDDKIATAEKYGLNLIKGVPGDGFSTDQGVIHYNDNSGAQSINLAILFGATYIILVGFDMQHAGGKSHFFGDHPQGLFQRKEYQSFAKKFKTLDGVTIVNATPGSALKAYPMMSLEAAIENGGVYRNGSVANAIAN